jgi:hypothetical protein
MKEIKAVAAEAAVASPGRANVTVKTRSTAREETPTFRPNAVTVAAMKESRQRRGLPRFTSMQALFDDLHADD